MRLGGALAMEVALECAQRLERIVLLEPVISGEEMMTQYLRARVAFSGIRSDPGRRETTAGLRERLAAGESLQVAGYVLTPGMVAAIDGIDLVKVQPDARGPVDWIAIAASNAGAVPEAWRKAGAQVKVHEVAVRPYWSHTRGVVEEYEPLARCLTGIFAEKNF
jgi:hypothetical protein